MFKAGMSGFKLDEMGMLRGSKEARWPREQISLKRQDHPDLVLQTVQAWHRIDVSLVFSCRCRWH